MRKAIVVSIFTNIALLGFASAAANDVAMSSMDNMVHQMRLQEFEEIIHQDELNFRALPIRSHYLTNITGNLYHWIDSFPQYNILKLEDGSEWDFDPASDGFIIRSWRAGDALVISPYISWFWESNYKYIITNKDLGSSIYVNPLIGPIEYGINSTWVCKLDHKNGKLYLTNGQGEKTIWDVASSDFDLFSHWELNDHVILGEDSSWLSTFSSFDHIIFNVNMNHHVRARLASPAY